MAMKMFKIIRKLTIYSFCLLGWLIIYCILLVIALNGGSTVFTINDFNEMLIELIIIPILLIILFIFIVFEVKNDS